MENEPVEMSPSIDNNPQKPHTPRNPKTVLYVVLAVIVAAAVIFGALQAKKNQNSGNKNDKTVSVTGAKKEINISAEEKKVLEAQADNYRAQIKNLPATASVEDRFSLYSKLAGVEYRLGKYEEAIADLNKIVGENENNHRIWTLYTNIYWDMENFPKAREASKRALDIDKENPQSWLAYIELQEDQGKDNINNLYQEALKKTDTAIDVVIAYARFLEKVGDKAGAITQWQKASEIFPGKKASYDAEIARLQAQK